MRASQPDLVTVIVTAFASVDSTLAALNEGAFAFLTKDSAPEVLVDTLLRAAENAQLRRENRRLRQTHEAILAAMPDLLLIVDSKLEVQNANHRHPMLCAAAPEPALPCPLVEFLAPFVRDRIEWMRLVLETRPDSPREASLTLRSDTGDIRSFSVRSTRLKNVHEPLLLIQVVDISDRVDLVRKLSESEGLATLGRLVAIIAHELRNPITGIRALAQMLNKTLGKDHSERDSVEEILTLTRRMSATLADILAYSRPRDPRENAEERIAVSELLEHVEREGRRWPACEGRSIEFVTSVQEPIFVLGERDRLFAAIANLAENALHACSEGGHVRLGLERAGERAVITIDDDGPGIPDEHVKRVFDPFFSTKKGGTGLGLPIVKATVDRHGGTLDVERSKLLGGARMIVRLPIDHAPTATP